ncbi:hypothetical protein M4914_17285 [Streptomyces somaliensis DSM 40738]|uniref:Uncharacterized protein n=1 Tax=Streptomyces somaliensis (strain ATCC 33201 / DSM 40738 / JCM 12659 / KCTC 9044 / NCTC 11332 / NRRL B-12077 / IP 733) TaxID=1134445 RepID=A0AA44DA72_STRE0|nr:hypothetical protein [Streptomyces somaliensis]MCQ0024537.1 hypothetical protein [Streptomyces somaliensis DSM 40738]NKY13007.1 hypothetical protein [Streptomyces somaliensis DSM 40738]
MTRVLLHEMRRGEAGKVALLSAVAGVWYLASADPASSDWIGWWNQASIKVQVFGVIVMGSLTSAAAAWSASRARRTRTALWADTTPRGGWPQALLLWAAAWLWSLLAYAVMTAVAFRRTASVSDVTDPVWSPLVLGAAMTGLQIAAGVAAGTLLPTRITAPVTGLLWYAVFVVCAFVPDLPLARLLPAVDEHLDTAYEPHTARFLVAAAWCAAAALALTAVPALVRREVPSPGPAAVVPAVVALVAGGALLSFRAPGPHPFWAVPAEQPARPVCVAEGRTEACLWPADRHLLPEAAAAVRTVDRALGRLTGFHRSFHETGLTVPGGTGGAGGTGVLGGAELPVAGPVVDKRSMTEAMLDASLPRPPYGCEPHMVPETGGYPDTFLVQALVHSRAGYPAPYYGDRFAAAVERVLKAPAAAQDAWLDAAARGIGACRPVPPLPR